MQLLNGTFSDAASHPSWTVTIEAPTHSPFDGTAEVAEAGSTAWAQQTEAALTADGFTPSATTIDWPQYADDPRGVLGVRVRVGAFATKADAATEAAALTADGFTALVQWEGFDPQQPPDAELRAGARRWRHRADPRHQPPARQQRGLRRARIRAHRRAASGNDLHRRR